MNDRQPCVVVLPGAGGGEQDFSVFADPNDVTLFVSMRYPGWPRYIADDFSVNVLIEELAKQISDKVPNGPIYIVGVSLGGHFGYSVALELQRNGREIGGFCALDSFMVATSAPSAGWRGRALTQALRLLRQKRIREFSIFLRSRLWRLSIRLGGDRIIDFLRTYRSTERLPLLFRLDPIFEKELSMRLLIRIAAPWVAKLDIRPKALNVPTVLIRTPSTAVDDGTWSGRCSDISICEIQGDHQTLFEKENLESIRKAFVTAANRWKIRLSSSRRLNRSPPAPHQQTQSIR